MTPERIEQLWQEAAARYGLDPVLGDKQAERALYHQPDHELGIRKSLDAMQVAWQKTPGFFETNQYDWVFSPRLWRRTIEVNYQFRALQQLSMLWRSPHRDPGWEFDNVVLRYSYIVDAFSCTPFHLQHEEAHFIVLPYVFSDFTLLLFAAFLDTVAAVDCGWDSLDPNGRLRPHVSPYLKQALLRLLTTDAFHPSDEGEPPMDRVRAASEWFRDSAEFRGKPSPLMVHLTYSFIDYAIGHELGHRLLGHQGTAGDRDDRLAAEKDADRLGFHLFSTSWGWRDEILDGSPLSSAARIVLGPLTFAAFERWYAAALLGLAVACQRAGSDAGFDVFGMKRIREEARARTRDTAQLVAGYKAAIAKGGVNLNEIDTAVIGALSRSMVAFVGTTMTSASSVPAGQIRLAREIARPVF